MRLRSPNLSSMQFCSTVLTVRPDSRNTVSGELMTYAAKAISNVHVYPDLTLPSATVRKPPAEMHPAILSLLFLTGWTLISMGSV